MEPAIGFEPMTCALRTRVVRFVVRSTRCRLQDGRCFSTGCTDFPVRSGRFSGCWLRHSRCRLVWRRSQSVWNTCLQFRL